MTGRTVPEWEGSAPDAAIPPRVKLRIWERHEGRCYLTGRKIMPGDPYDFDHITALCNGGRHAESNLAPVLREAHKAKTADDRAMKAKVDRMRKKHLGFASPSRMPGSKNSTVKRKLDGRLVDRATGEPIGGYRK